VMKGINHRFQAEFGREAGSVFDTNLYVEGGGPKIKAEIAAGPKVWADADAKAAHDEGQDIASLVKQRKYSTPEQWNTFTAALKTGLETKLIHPPMTPEQMTIVQAKIDAQ